MFNVAQMLPTTLTGDPDVLSDDLSRAAGFLSEPAVDILHHKIAPAMAQPAGLAQEELEMAFPKEPKSFRAERLEHGLVLPRRLLDSSLRLAAVEREQYSELQLLLELASIYLESAPNAPNPAAFREEAEHCILAMRRLDSLLPQLHYLLGVRDLCNGGQMDAALLHFERSLQYGGCPEALLKLAELHIASNAAYSKMLLNKLKSHKNCKVRLLMGKACMQLGQFEEAGEHLKCALDLEEHSMLYHPPIL
jgi:tetratricopeptide (TPR) repeat protein